MRKRSALRRSMVLACVLGIQETAVQAAQSTPAVLPANVIACMDERDAGKRLACYDRELALVVGKSPAVSAASPAAPASTPNSFGMTPDLQRQQNGPLPTNPAKLSTRITAVSYEPRGAAIVTLENGQVWEEAENGSHLPLRPGDTVTIKSGMLGAFYMSSAQVPGLRVKRVR
jgi:hypothetical protein